MLTSSFVISGCDDLVPLSQLSRGKEILIPKKCVVACGVSNRFLFFQEWNTLLLSR